TFTITVIDAQLPVITSQPVNRTVCAGRNAFCTVTGTNAVSYQWQSFNGSSWVNIAGATGSSFTVPGVTLAMNTNAYRVNLIGLCTTVTSGIATLFVNSLPTISISSSRPASLLPGDLVDLVATGTPGGGSF